MDIFQIYMAIHLALYFGLIIGMRSFMLYRATKINPIKNFGSKSKVGKHERMIQFGLFLMLIIGLNFCFLEENYRYFYPITGFEMGWLKTVGFILSIIGFLLTFMAQIQMKNSWRLGIDQENTVDLVTTGMYQYSRNPVYFGLGFVFIGFFLIAPNVGSLIFLIIMAFSIHKKVIDEEEFLSQKIPDEYSKYAKKVRRWI